MKAEIKVIPAPVVVQPPPTKQVILTLTEREARVLKSVCDWHGQVADALILARGGIGGGLSRVEVNDFLYNIFSVLPHPEISVILS